MPAEPARPSTASEAHTLALLAQGLPSRVCAELSLRPVAALWCLPKLVSRCHGSHKRSRCLYTRPGGSKIEMFEAEWGVLMFTGRVHKWDDKDGRPGRGSKEMLLIFGPLHARRGAEMKVLYCSPPQFLEPD